jgi:poly-beta-1,6-N-acetyl-D-glucosamine synthase
MSRLCYAIITPAHNEARFLPEVIRGVVEQTLRPARWIIVDDRSTDRTPEIISAAARQYDFIKPVILNGDPTRRLGANVVHAFNHGLAHLDIKADIIVKMDADAFLPRAYFAFLLQEFEADPRLGAASGKMFYYEKDHWVMERYSDMHVPGLCKAYRATCFQKLGGLIPILGWDILDVAKARMLNWTVRSFADMPVFHLRQMGLAMGMMKTHLSYGHCVYSLQAHPLFVLGRAVYRAMEKPYLSGLLIVWGYLMAALKKAPRLDEPKLVRFMRREQLGRLTGRTLAHERLAVRSLEETGHTPPEISPALLAWLGRVRT